MSFLSDQVSAGFSQAFDLTRELVPGESGNPITVTFGSLSAPGVRSELTEGHDMLPGGYRLEFDAQITMRYADFKSLGIVFESEIQADGRTLRVKKISHQMPFVILHLVSI